MEMRLLDNAEDTYTIPMDMNNDRETDEISDGNENC